MFLLYLSFRKSRFLRKMRQRSTSPLQGALASATASVFSSKTEPLPLNPKYAIEIINLPQIIGLWAFTVHVSMHLWVHLKYAANTHKPSISRIFGNSVA
jgi:hypothetical protein